MHQPRLVKLSCRVKILPVAEAFFSPFCLREIVQAWVLFFEREFHWKFEREVLWCLGARLLDPWKIFPAVLFCLRRLLIWALNPLPWLGSERRCVYRRLMLCSLFVYTVFLHTADAWPRPASSERGCADVCELSPAVKGLTRVRGQSTAFEKVLKFRTGVWEEK